MIYGKTVDWDYCIDACQHLFNNFCKRHRLSHEIAESIFHNMEIHDNYARYEYEDEAEAEADFTYAFSYTGDIDALDAVCIISMCEQADLRYVLDCAETVAQGIYYVANCERGVVKDEHSVRYW